MVTSKQVPSQPSPASSKLLYTLVRSPLASLGTSCLNPCISPGKRISSQEDKWHLCPKCQALP